VLIWAGMATMSSRDDMRQMAVNSLLPQVDRLIVANGDTRGDQAKFLACEHAPAGSVFLGVDDDLIYPPDYVATILAGLDRHPGCIVSFHGWNMDDAGELYVDNYRCLENVAADIPVHVAGTGVCAFNLDTVRPLMSDFESVNADVWLALKAERAGIPRVVLAHPSYWLGYSQQPATGRNAQGEPVPLSVYAHTRFKMDSPLDGNEGMRRALGQLHDLLYA
jgi:hypothetical protein